MYLISLPAHRLGLKKKEADNGIRPSFSRNPSILFEVGSSETSKQLRIDAKLWIEHLPEVSQPSPIKFVII